MDTHSSKVIGFIRPISPLRFSLVPLSSLVYALGLVSSVFAQGLSSSTPAKEYIRLGDRIIAIENVVGVPASITVSSGTPQSANINTNFATVFNATVYDASTKPIAGVPVTFTVVPAANGAEGLWSSATTMIVNSASNGVAGVPNTFHANNIAGTYTVQATVAGVATPAIFTFNNLTPAAIGSITVAAGTSPLSGTVGKGFPSTMDAKVTDVNNNIVAGAVVTWTLPTSGPSATFATGVNTATTGADGVAISHGFTANDIAGSYLVPASAGGFSVNFSLTNLPGPAAAIAASQGNGGTATINSAFSPALQATVTDSYGNGVPGLTVTFAVQSGGGSSGTFAGGVNTATTNSSGVATAPTLTANGTPGSFSVIASVSGLTPTATFNLSISGAAAAHISVQSGTTPQSATINTAFATLLAVKVTDSNNNPISNATVTFAAPTTGASGTFAGGVNTALTNSSGIATAAAFTANSIANTVGTNYLVTASVSGVSTSFTLTNNPGPAASIAASSPASESASVNTAFSPSLAVTVTDASNNPINGLTVTFTIQSNGSIGGTFSGGATTATPTTNSSGVATAPTLTANGNQGTFSVKASVSGLSSTVSFSLKNNAPTAAHISVNAGNNQFPALGAALTPLSVLVTDSSNNPVGTVSVTFTANVAGNGATATFAGGVATATATTNASGIATAPTLTANNFTALYTVTATVTSTSLTTSFTETNDNGPTISAVTVSGITATSATITWTTADTATSQVNYGTTTSYGQNVSNSTAVTSHSLQLTGLTAGTPYYFQVSSTDTFNDPQAVAESPFTTLALTYTISVNVSYYQNATIGIQNVQVLINGAPQSTLTNSSGSFVSGPEPSGAPYTVSLQYAGSGNGYVFSQLTVANNPCPTISPLNCNAQLYFSAQPILAQTNMQGLNQAFTSNQFQTTLSPITASEGLPEYYVNFQLLFVNSGAGTSSVANSCYFWWQTGNDIVLENDAGNGSLPLLQPFYDATSYFSVDQQPPTGEPRMETHNSQCLVDLYNSYFDFPTGDQLVEIWTAFYFFNSFSGPKDVYMQWAGGSPWVKVGSWTVPGPEQTDANLTVTAPATVTANTSFNITGTVTFTSQTSQGGSVWVYWDWVTNLGSAGVGQATINGGNFTFAMPGLPRGTHTITVMTYDPGQRINLIGAVAPRLTVTAQ